MVDTCWLLHLPPDPLIFLVVSTTLTYIDLVIHLLMQICETLCARAPSQHLGYDLFLECSQQLAQNASHVGTVTRIFQFPPGADQLHMCAV